jgi:transcriptional regulator with XRE-family HTH domain
VSATPTTTAAQRLAAAVAADGRILDAIAAEAGMDRRHLGRIATGETRLLVADVAALARVLRVRAEWIAFGDGGVR